MPTYDYKCNACEHAFESFHTMSEDNTPDKKSCPKCKEKQITKTVSKPAGIGVDSTLTPNKKTGGDWNEMMGRIKKGLPERYRAGIDKSTNMTGKRWSG